jgi:predicted DNA-binding transcriptional regulator AlpA
MTPFITADSVADLTGYRSAAEFLRHRARLEADHLFPLPMPTSTRPLRWRRDEVQAWVNRQGLPKAPPVVLPAPGGNIHLLRLARTA